MERIIPPASTSLFTPEILALCGIALLLVMLAIRAIRGGGLAARGVTSPSRRGFGGPRKSWYRKPSRQASHLAIVAPIAANLTDPAAQMEAVHQSGFERTRLLNKEEALLLPILEDTVRSLGQGYRVMAQTSLGELIRPIGSNGNTENHRNALAAINSKRLDFAIIDQSNYLVCAVEYQGTGHYQDRAFMRDAVKREALRKAGVPMIEPTPGITADSLTMMVRTAISARR